MYRLAGPMRSFVQAYRTTLHHVAVVSTMGSSGAANAVREIAAILGRAPVAAAAFTRREIEGGSGAARLLSFGDSLLEAAGAHPDSPAQVAASAAGARAVKP